MRRGHDTNPPNDAIALDGNLYGSPIATTMTRYFNLIRVFLGSVGGLAGVWLLLFAVPALVNAHSDAALVLALALVVAVPAGLAWGARRLASLSPPEEHDDD